MMIISRRACHCAGSLLYVSCVLEWTQEYRWMKVERVNKAVDPDLVLGRSRQYCLVVTLALFTRYEQFKLLRCR